MLNLLGILANCYYLRKLKNKNLEFNARELNSWPIQCLQCETQIYKFHNSSIGFQENDIGIIGKNKYMKRPVRLLATCIKLLMLRIKAGKIQTSIGLQSIGLQRRSDKWSKSGDHSEPWGPGLIGWTSRLGLGGVWLLPYTIGGILIAHSLLKYGRLLG
jgi:hypothetical protein